MITAFKIAFYGFIAWKLIGWRFRLWRRRARLRKQGPYVKPLTPGEAVARMPASDNDNDANALAHNIPVKALPMPSLANDNTVTPLPPPPPPPPAPPPAKRNERIIGDVISAMINLGMTKRKAKAHVNLCYDAMNGSPSLNALLSYSIKSLAT